MNKRGRTMLMLLAGGVLIIVLQEAWEHVRPFFIDMCNAGRGGCQ